MGGRGDGLKLRGTFEQTNSVTQREDAEPVTFNALGFIVLF